jgi:hypothetical protein
MDFRQASPSKQANAKKAPVKRKTASTAQQSRIVPFAQKVPNPISRQQSLQQIAAEEQEFDDSPWGDTDEEVVHEDPIEISEDDVPLAVVTKKAAARPARKAAGSAKKAIKAMAVPFVREDEVDVPDRADASSPCDMILQGLKAWRKAVSCRRRWELMSGCSKERLAREEFPAGQCHASDSSVDAA